MTRLRWRHSYTPSITILAVRIRKVGRLNYNIKTKIFDFEARDLIGWLANTLASQPIRTYASKSNIFVFILSLRWRTFFTAIIYSRAHKLFGHPRVFILTIMIYVKRIIFQRD